MSIYIFVALNREPLVRRKGLAYLSFKKSYSHLLLPVDADIGRFTRAHARRLGKVETTQRGTLFLDEVGDLSLGMQAKLLRFLETGTFERHGGEALQSDVRVIAAPLRDLDTMVAAGTFRQDLALLLQKIQINIPPLRERQEDILRLATHFIKQMAVSLKKEAPRLSTEVEVALQEYDWPGNLKELEHRIQRAVVVCEASVIQKEDLVL